MKAKIYIDTDATVTTYSFQNIKMPRLCGDIRIIHLIIEVLTNNSYADIPKDIRIANADIYFRDHVSGATIAITLDMLMEWSKHIDNPNNATPQGAI